MLVEERKRYLFHFVHLANACLLLFAILFARVSFWLSLFFTRSLFPHFLLTWQLSQQSKKKKLKFRSCFASINAWLANFAHMKLPRVTAANVSGVDERDVCVRFFGNFRQLSILAASSTIDTHKTKDFVQITYGCCCDAFLSLSHSL